MKNQQKLKELETERKKLAGLINDFAKKKELVLITHKTQDENKLLIAVHNALEKNMVVLSKVAANK